MESGHIFSSFYKDTLSAMTKATLKTIKLVHGVQRRMISVDIFFIFLRLLVFALVCYMRPSAR